jgi:hypothetical protein
MEQMHDEIDVIQKHPPSLLHAFDVVGDAAFLLELFLNVLTERSNVRVGGTAGDHEEIRHVRHALQPENHDVDGLVVSQDGRRAFRELRHIGRRGIGTGGWRCHCCQVNEWTTATHGSGRYPRAGGLLQKRMSLLLDNPNSDFGFHVSMESDGHPEDAQGAEGLVQVDLPLLDLEALRFQLMGDVGPGD